MNYEYDVEIHCTPKVIQICNPTSDGIIVSLAHVRDIIVSKQCSISIEKILDLPHPVLSEFVKLRGRFVGSAFGSTGARMPVY